MGYTSVKYHFLKKMNPCSFVPFEARQRLQLKPGACRSRKIFKVFNNAPVSEIFC